LRDLTLTIPRGQRIALVGPSGAGKSTLAQLLLRLYDPQSGSVRLGGVDLRKFEASDLRKQFGVVPQDPFIFRTTMRDNIRVARSDASDDAIRRACELANAWEFIARLPGGLDACVGEGGSSLSGGQRQRLAIARAILRDPTILLLDEATSALDAESEALVQEALARLMRGRTTLVIAHRLSTVAGAHRVVVVDGGQVVEAGTHAELLARAGPYRRLVERQMLSA
jgi:ATP-binding cassette subfamily B protein